MRCLYIHSELRLGLRKKPFLFRIPLYFMLAISRNIFLRTMTFVLYICGDIFAEKSTKNKMTAHKTLQWLRVDVGGETLKTYCGDIFNRPRKLCNGFISPVIFSGDADVSMRGLTRRNIIQLLRGLS